MSRDREIFDALSQALENLEGEIDVGDIVTAIQRLAAVLCVHAPTDDARENMTMYSKAVYDIYVYRTLEMNGLTPTVKEKADFEKASKILMEPTEGGMVN